MIQPALHPSLHRAALAGLERAINRALELDRATRARLKALDGHRFHLHCTNPELHVVLSVSGEELLLGSDSAGKMSTTLKGSLAEFIGIAVAEDPAAALINGDVQVSGDTGPLLELRRQLAGLDIDWEQPLSRLVGDVAAHQIGRQVRAGQRWAGQALRHLRRQLGEFLREESELVPHPIQVEDFYREIDELSARGDRLQARLQQAKQRVARHLAQKPKND